MSASREQSHPVLIPDGPKLTLKDRKDEVAPPVDRHRKLDKRALRKQKQEEKKRTKKTSKAPKGSSAFLESFLGLLFVCALGGGLIYHRVTGQELLPDRVVNLSAISLVAGFYVVILIESFSQDMLQGMLCLFIPPYMLVYGLFFSDTGPLKGFTLGLILFLGAEIYYVPDDSLALRGQKTLTGWVRGGQQLIGGDRPDAGFN